MRACGSICHLSRYGVHFITARTLARAVLPEWQSFSCDQGIGLVGYATGRSGQTPSPLLETDPRIMTASSR